MHNMQEYVTIQQLHVKHKLTYFLSYFAYCSAYFFAYFADFLACCPYCSFHILYYGAYWGKLVRASFCSAAPKESCGVSRSFDVFSQSKGGVHGRIRAAAAQSRTIDTGPAAAPPEQLLPVLKPSLHQCLKSLPVFNFVLCIHRRFGVPVTKKVSMCQLNVVMEEAMRMCLTILSTHCLPVVTSPLK